MRRLALTLGLVLALLAPPAIFAHDGLPDVAAVQAGPYVVTVLNDSPSLVTGRNTLTVQAPDLPRDHTIALTLYGPTGEVVAAPLQPVWVLGVATPGQDEAVQAPSAADHAAMGHQLAGDTMARSAPRAATPGGHGAVGGQEDATAFEATGYLARTTVSLVRPGRWQAHLVVEQSGQERYMAHTIVDVVPGGPSLLYLAGTGSVIGAFLLFGVVQRRRQASISRKGR